MRPSILWGMVVLVIVGIALLLWFVPGRGVRTHTTQSILLCRQILIGIDLLEQSETADLSADASSDSVSLNRKTATLLLKRNPGEIRFGKLIANDGLFRDAWGTPLLFCATNTPSIEKVNSRLKGKSRILTVWSAGPNATNEFGFGDDVFSDY